MSYQSPFLRLDELKRKRDAETFDTMVNSAREFGQAPLTLDKMMKENEDRAAKAKQAQFNNDLNESKLLETGMHNDALEKVAAQNANTSGIRAETGVKAEDRRTNVTENKEQLDFLDKEAFGRVAANLATPDDEIIDSINKSPGYSNINRDRVAYAVMQARRKIDADEHKKQLEQGKLEDSKRRTEGIRARASRVTDPKPRLMGEGILKTLGEKTAMRKKVAGLINKIQNISSGDTPGLLEDLKEKYGGIAGIQDNQTRMEYLGLFNQILRDRSGMAVTAPELERLEQEIPNWRAGQDVILDGLGRILNDVETEISTTIEIQQGVGGRTVPGSSPVPAKQKPVPPKNAGEKRSDYAKRLFSSGFTEDEVMKIVMGG